MKTLQYKSLIKIFFYSLLIAPAMATADSFFDITYDLSDSIRGQAPELTATLSDGSAVPLKVVRIVRFPTANKGFKMRIVADQELQKNVETVLISAKCSPAKCTITNVEQKRYEFRGHVTVLK
jgi:hypothetical protein